jgi:signal transduction histidine kinase
MSNGEIFIADAKSSLWRLDKQKNQLVSTSLLFEDGHPNHPPAKNLFLWENGMDNPVLINTDKAWKVLYQNGKLIARLICNQVPQDALIRYAQYDEPTNTIFIGTDSKGLIIIKQNQVEALRKERATANQRTSYYSQAELPDGNIITNEGHILGRNTPEKTTAPFQGAFSTGTFMMGDSLFWFVQKNSQLDVSCLHSYNFKTRRLTAYKKIKDNFSQLVMAMSGGVLYLSNEYGIYKMQADSLQPVYKYPVPNKLGIHFDMKEIKPGVLAIANCNSLLSYTIAANKLDTIYTPGNYCVRTIWVYNDYLFSGTYGNGFFISKNGKTKAVPLDKNRYLLFTHCFIDDGNGFCWISTNRGLFKVSIADMINAYETDAAQVYYHYFGRNDGMDMTEMNGGCMPCGLMLRNKTISFPTMEGMLWVSPQTINPVLPNGEIFIDEILVDNKRMAASLLEQKPLTAVNHDMQIRLGFSAWCNKENIYLEYQLNKDTVWKSVNTDNGAVIQLNNISKGNYVLRIRKLNGFGVNNYSYKEIRFTIPTPWYQRWWFYLLGLAAAWGLLFLYLRYRTSQLKLRQRNLEKQVDEKTKELQGQNELLEKSNSIKTRLISIISHDIVTPLKFLTVAGKNLQEKRAQMPEALQQETIEEMTNTSQELQLLSTNILNWIKYQNENRRQARELFNLHEMVNQVLGILQSLARQKNLVVENKVAPDTEIYQFYEPLKILVYNLLTNAIHFTERGKIAVTAVTEEGGSTLSVTDEGVGMAPEQIQRIMLDEVVITSANVDNKKGHGLGYLIIKDLIKTMGARLIIESKKNEGTTVSIVIPSLH